jgi:hypothetical protein
VGSWISWELGRHVNCYVFVYTSWLNIKSIVLPWDCIAHSDYDSGITHIPKPLYLLLKES